MTSISKMPHDLILEGQGLVRSLAWAISRGLPRNVDIDDLIGFGQIGLAEAARDYDSSLGYQFSTFAYHRIRGAIYDGLGKMAWFRRQRQTKLQFSQLAEDVLRAEAEHPAEHAAVAVNVDDDWNWLKRITSNVAVAYLVTHTADDDEAAQLVDDDCPAPDHAAVMAETRLLLHQLIEELPEQSRNLMRGAYFDGLTLQEAGQRVGISKAWASRLHSKTLDGLARALRQRGIAD